MKIIITFCLLTILLVPLSVSAQGQGLIPTCASNADEVCGICDMLWTIGKFSQLILGLVGSLALLFFIIAGFQWITSQGNSEKVKNAANLMKNTVIGVAIVAFAWLIVNLVIGAFVGVDYSNPKNVKLFNSTVWYEVCKQKPSQ